MRVGETHPFGGKLIDEWGPDLGVWVVATGVSISEVIGKDVDDVRVGRCLQRNHAET